MRISPHAAPIVLKTVRISGAPLSDDYTGRIPFLMTDPTDNFDAYVSLLKRVRIVSSNPSLSKECMIAFTHVNFTVEASQPVAEKAGEPDVQTSAATL